MNKERIKKILEVVTICCVFLLIFCQKVYADEQIYFDEDGNLIYVTHDKKATTPVSYKAIGWILKRYDAPIDAAGQQYVIVRKIEYAVEDTSNPEYLYCYFWSDKNEILDAVGKVSTEWRRQLEKYGDTVYIDNVMTVCNNKVPLGNVDANGKCTGEVYYTYEGIANARPWKNSQYLKSYFDIKLDFPILSSPPEIELLETVKSTKFLESSGFMMMETGSNEYGKEVYDVSEGMPAGEKLYFLGECNSYHYGVTYTDYTQTVNFPVRVDTKYTVKWVDINGVNKSETKTISRWYQIPKNITYSVVDSYRIFDLTTVEVNAALLGATEILYQGTEGDKVTVSKSNYGDYTGHLKATVYSCKTADVVLTSNNFKKPAIPEVNYTTTAEAAVKNVQVRSDYLSIDGKVVLSNSYKALSGAKPTNIQQDNTSLYKSGIPTLENKKNGNYADFTMICKYTERTSKTARKYANVNVNSVRIHTPVVCNGSVYGDKSINQAESPVASDVVVGGKLYVNVNAVGTHKDIKGYGTRNYSKYVGEVYVKFPFSVKKGSTTYNANEWIMISTGASTFTVPETVNIGSYTVSYKAIAKNGDTSMSIGKISNQNSSEYGASNSSKVNLIGRISDFEIADENTYYVGTKDRNGKELSAVRNTLMPYKVGTSVKNAVKLSLTSVGRLTSGAYIEGNVKHYFIDKESGEIMPVDLYVQNGNNLSDYEKTDESIIIDRACASDQGNNTFVWQTDYIMPHSFIAVPKGEDLDYEDSSNFCKNGVIAICFDFSLTNGSYKKILYINEENYQNGYCNMWRMQGGIESIELYENLIDIPDGTAVLLEVGADSKYDYEVNGTH